MGRILGLDPGSHRIGVALSDPLRIIAQPLDVIAVADFDHRLRTLVAEHDVERVVVGLPISLSGREGPAAERARRLVGRVVAITGLPVDLCDERFTTRTAEDALVSAGVRRRARRGMVDKVAASVMLQHYLDASSPGPDGN
jgi:putative holliday junction resolvase